MRALSMLVFMLLALPMTMAGSPPQEGVQLTGQETQEDSDDRYVSVCRLPTTPSGAGLLVADCTTTGVYQESNGIEGLQVRAGAYTDDNGNTVAYVADSKVHP